MSKRDHRGGDVAALAAARAPPVPLAFVSLPSAIAGVLADGRPVGLGLSGALSVLVRLPGKLANPALAWPIATRRTLPGAFALQIELVLSTLLVVGTVALLVSLLARHMH